MSDGEKSTALVPATSQALEPEILDILPSPFIPPESELARRLRRMQTTISFLRYREDNTLRLFKEGSIVGTEPAGYADERVTVKARVQRPTEDYVVILTVKRQQLARPDAEEWLAWMAYEYRS